jgi:hypothetical protein
MVEFSLLMSLLVLLANLSVLALNVKLYTEVMKDKNMDRRSGKANVGQ